MKRILLYSFCGVFLLACEKQMDEASKGPKAKITIINAALDSDPVTLVLDGEKVNDTAVKYDQATGTAENAYLETAPGVRSTVWQVGNTQPAQGKLFHWMAGAHYTIIQYDTAVLNKAPVLIVSDNPAPNDTIAKSRFINCVAGDQKLSLWLINTTADTLKVAVNYSFIGVSGSVLSEFSSGIQPGDWEMRMADQEGNILYSEHIVLAAKTCYSFVAIGEKGGTGLKEPHVKTLVQLK